MRSCIYSSNYNECLHVELDEVILECLFIFKAVSFILLLFILDYKNLQANCSSKYNVIDGLREHLLV